MSEKYLLFDLSDEKSKKLGEVISNPTCKKIVNLLADKELGISEIARELEMPINSVQYNVEKLLESGIIESTNSFWSVKGKKMPSYKVANKLIVISPKKSNIYSKLKTIVPVVISSALLTSLFFLGEGKVKNNTSVLLEKTLSFAQDTAGVASQIENGSSGLSLVSYSLIGIWALIILFIGWAIIKKD